MEICHDYEWDLQEEKEDKMRVEDELRLMKKNVRVLGFILISVPF